MCCVWCEVFSPIISRSEWDLASCQVVADTLFCLITQTSDHVRGQAKQRNCSSYVILPEKPEAQMRFGKEIDKAEQRKVSYVVLPDYLDLF